MPSTVEEVHAAAREIDEAEAAHPTQTSAQASYYQALQQAAAAERSREAWLRDLGVVPDHASAHAQGLRAALDRIHPPREIANAVPWRDGPPRDSRPTLSEGVVPPSESELETQAGRPYRDGRCALCGQALVETTFRRALRLDSTRAVAVGLVFGGAGEVLYALLTSDGVLAGCGLGLMTAAPILYRILKRA